jgi:aminoglycoside phosphotransferase (APT) family kinase protein
MALYGDPRTRGAAVAMLGRTLRGVHDLPLPPGSDARDPRELVASIWSGIPATFAVPAFVGGAVRRVLTEDAPARERAVVLSHNDVNPTNIVFDGEKLLLLDWDTAGPNDPLYDLAAISMFLRMDTDTCQQLLEAHDGAPVGGLPARFTYSRRLIAVACGVIFLHLARTGGYAPAAPEETLDATPSLGELYQRMRSGSLHVGTPEGQWAFGLALAKESTTL